MTTDYVTVEGEQGSPSDSSPFWIKRSRSAVIAILEGSTGIEISPPGSLFFLLRRRGIFGASICFSQHVSTSLFAAYSLSTCPEFLPGIPNCLADAVQLISLSVRMFGSNVGASL